MKIDDLHSLFSKSSGISTDTRTIKKNDIFFCLKGEKFDGNLFIDQAFHLGASFVIYDDEKLDYKSEKAIKVKNVLKTLQALAKYHRSKFNIPVIGLTGSNGKTTSKELINSVLSQKFNVTFTSNNFNNHIGVPLTILKINRKTDLAIIEMGANHLGEIDLLCNIADPNIGYITNFGKAHLEGFGGIEGVIKGKSELYEYIRESKGVILINNDDRIQREKSRGINTFSFGKSKKSDYSIYNTSSNNSFCEASLNDKKITSNLYGEYNFENINASIAMGIHFGLSFEQIENGIKNYIPKNNRSEMIKTKKNLLFVDSYNANPSSMKLSIQSFMKFKEVKKTLILGDMHEIGKTYLIEHERILNSVKNNKDLKIFLVGKIFNQLKFNSGRIHFFNETNELIEYFKKNLITGHTILLKGSRKINLEKVIPIL
ncbi:MAG: UDP-N-acetylmuramoyl-tripeptide--D-alanyl-D-alanine ligase [Flavobacteriales bacterium]|nr:MAG: UDP-N-acetylmuramoyl-tripeptide--D-alanyl-D-alanine ligase [Flavobacteriales bacterium]|tara:strand:- start:1064 stop:2350 length:1287 start_codon:yes stop_codon:yes gene_type:complete